MDAWSRREAQEHRLGELYSAVMKVPADATPAEAAAAVVPRPPSPTAEVEASSPSRAITTHNPHHPTHPRLDGAERQRHMRLWAKQLADEQSRIKAEEHVAQLLSSDGDDEAKQAAIRAAAAGPSFVSEIMPEAHVSPRGKAIGFAYGGIYPGTLHARGQLVKTHTVSFAVRDSARSPTRLLIHPCVHLLQRVTPPPIAG